MGTRAVDKGPTAVAVASNVRAIRDRRGWSQQQLAGELANVGRPMQASAVAKIETGDRRVDVDDLVALAVVLNVPVARLLLPDTDDPEATVQLLSEVELPVANAWGWLSGEHTLLGDEDIRGPEVGARNLAYMDERPLWLRLAEQEEIVKALRHLNWLVRRAVAYAPRLTANQPTRKATRLVMLKWLEDVEDAQRSLCQARERLAAEGVDRG